MEAGNGHEHTKTYKCAAWKFQIFFFNTEAKSAYTNPLQTENLQTELTKRG
jgi:hypothetical protein